MEHVCSLIRSCLRSGGGRCGHFMQSNHAIKASRISAKSAYRDALKQQLLRIRNDIAPLTDRAAGDAKDSG